MTAVREYHLDRDYEDRRDKGAPNQFVRWLGIKNAGGIREMLRKTRAGDVRDVAALILVSRHVSGAGYNPWQDIVDKLTGRIWFWGDAKADARRSRDDFVGNRRLLQVWEAVQTQRFDLVPPILHFSKHEKGRVRFNGVCVLEKLEEAWFEDGGVRVRNYRAVLDVLPVEHVPVAWLQARRADLQVSPVDLVDGASIARDAPLPPSAPPSAWRTYTASGRYLRLTTYANRIRSRQAQLPSPESDAWSRLETLHRLSPEAFENRVVDLFSHLDVAHRIDGTRHVRDGGFDFFGSFVLPPPLSYRIPIKGEVKRYEPAGGGVGPKDVSRLVARLRRGEHGLFVTTSYFTKQCQEEVYGDEYPVELIGGGQLVGMLTQIGA